MIFDGIYAHTDTIISICFVAFQDESTFLTSIFEALKILTVKGIRKDNDTTKKLDDVSVS